MTIDAEDPAPENAGHEAVVIQGGHSRRVLAADGSDPALAGRALAIIAMQPESPDDGGSQSPVATLLIGGGPAGRTHIDFDVRDGTTVAVPAGPFQVSVRNLNDADGPAVTVTTFFTWGPPRGEVTRTFDIGYGMDDPNIRVPAFASGFVFDHGRPDDLGYRALLSDSATGETYGMAPPFTRTSLNSRSRFVRFFGLAEQSMGTVTFFLAI